MDTNALLRKHGYNANTVDNFGQIARRAAELASQPGATQASVIARIKAEFGQQEYLALRDKPQPFTL
jgi:hypothetical protein